MATQGISVNVSLSDTVLTISKSLSFTADQTNERYSAGTKSIPTTAAGTAFPVSDVTTPRWAYFKNMEPAGGNFVKIGNQTTGTFYPLIRLAPQQAAVFPLDVTPYGVADTAAVKVDFVILDN